MIARGYERKNPRFDFDKSHQDDSTLPDVTLRTDGYDRVSPLVNRRTHASQMKIDRRSSFKVSRTISKSANIDPIDHDDTEIFVERQFNQIDKNKDGFLTIDEVALAIRNLGFNETEAVDFIKTFDRNGDGRVTLIEFKESLSSYSMTDYENMKYHYLFKKLDADGNGTLSVRELRDFLALIGHNAEIPVIRDFIKQATNHQKEILDEDTFIKFLKMEIGTL